MYRERSIISSIKFNLIISSVKISVYDFFHISSDAPAEIFQIYCEHDCFCLKKS